MEINKTKLSSYTPEQLMQKGNFKIECTGDDCYVIDIDSDDTEASVVLENSENKKETTKTKKTRLSSYTPEQLAQKGDFIIECTGDDCYVIEPDYEAEKIASPESTEENNDTSNKEKTTTEETNTDNITTNEKTDNNKTSKSTSSLKLQTVSASNYKSKIASEGTTWVIFTNPVSCGHCVSVGKVLPSVLKKITNEDVKSILSINLRDSNNKEIGKNMDLLYSLMRKFGVTSGQYPFAVKYVDGKPVEMKTTIDKGSTDETKKYLKKLFNS